MPLPPPFTESVRAEFMRFLQNPNHVNRFRISPTKHKLLTIFASDPEHRPAAGNAAESKAKFEALRHFKMIDGRLHKISSKDKVFKQPLYVVPELEAFEIIVKVFHTDSPISC